jgi:beta-glucosidase/6-phospho-beta-glucosidase/beta-galactosidase
MYEDFVNGMSSGASQVEAIGDNAVRGTVDWDRAIREEAKQSMRPY